MKKLGYAIALLGVARALPAAASITFGVVTGGTALTDGGVYQTLGPPLLNPFGPPDSVGNDNFQSPDLFGFNEDQGVLLAAPLTVDAGTSPIPAGTVVSSYYVFFDPGPESNCIGNVNFSSNVLGIITSAASLAASDFLANPGVNYVDTANRGLEAGDSVTISGPQQILFDTTASTLGDYIRVITASSPVPEPASALLLGTGLGAALLARKRPRR